MSEPLRRQEGSRAVTCEGKTLHQSSFFFLFKPFTDFTVTEHDLITAEAIPQMPKKLCLSDYNLQLYTEKIEIVIAVEIKL